MPGKNILDAHMPCEWSAELIEPLIRSPHALYTTLRDWGRCDLMGYLKKYPDVRRSGMSPLRHFVYHGIIEKRIMGTLPTETIRMTYDDFLQAPLYFDCLVPLGGSCRTAHYLKISDLRYFSTPFDWMMSYSLMHVVQLIKTNMNDFFVNYQIIEERQKNFVVKDNKTGMIAMHHFPIGKSIDEYMPFFQKTIRVKFDCLVREIKSAAMLGFIFHGREDHDIDAFQNYINDITGTRCYVLNIKSSRERYIEFDPYKLKYTFYFWDVYSKGEDRSNPWFWVGNPKMWQLITGNIYLR